jgi:pyroglutamyl-peptidase
LRLEPITWQFAGKFPKRSNSVLKPRLLVTGFGPFPGVATNPSAAVARLVAASPRFRRLGAEAQAIVLPTAYASIEDVLAPALAEGNFDALLMVGVAGRAKTIRVERRAANRANPLAPDVKGKRRTGLALAAGPAHRASAVSAPRALYRLRRHGLPCRSSQDAGRYLCNATYFSALSTPIPVLFLHIPKPPPKRARRRRGRRARGGWHERLVAAFVEIGIDLLDRARRSGSHRSPHPLAAGEAASPAEGC